MPVRGRLHAALVAAVNTGGFDRGNLRKPKAMTPEEVSRILSEFDPRDRLLFEFLAKSGCRISAVARCQVVRPGTTETESRCSTCIASSIGASCGDSTKTAAGTRQVPLTPDPSQSLLVAAPSAYSTDTNPIFATKTGTHIDAHGLRRTIVKPARNQGVTPPTFRHSYATALRESGIDPKQRGQRRVPITATGGELLVVAASRHRAD